MKLKNTQLSIIFTISLFLIALIVGITGVIYSYIATKSILEEKVDSNLRQLANAHAHHIETFFKDKKNKVFDFSLDNFMQESISEIEKTGFNQRSGKIISKYLQDYNNVDNSDFYEISVLDKNGLLIGSTNENIGLGKDFSEKVFYKKSQRTSYLSDFVYDDDLDKQGMIISAPIIIGDQFSGVVVFKLSVDVLKELVQDIVRVNKIGAIEVEEAEDVYLMDNDGFFIVVPKRFKNRDDVDVLSGDREKNISDDSPKFCLGEISDGSKRMVYERSASFTDLYGNEYITTHTTIPETNWCLMVEVDKDNVVNKPILKYVINQLIVLTIVLVVINSFGLFYQGQGL